MKLWRIVGFNHPENEKCVIYKQNLSDEKLIDAVKDGIAKGCNIFSIRGFEKKNTW